MAKVAEQLDTFTRNYIECALWSSMDHSNEQGGEPLDGNCDISDLAPVTLYPICQADCRSKGVALAACKIPPRVSLTGYVQKSIYTRGRQVGIGSRETINIMDPIANLKEQLEIANDITRVWDDCSGDETLTAEQNDYVACKAARLAELVIALDEWQRKGGFSPYVKPLTGYSSGLKGHF